MKDDELDDKGTSNIDLEEIAKALRIPHFLGVFMNNEITSLKRLPEMNFIMNFQDSNQEGSHWTSVIVHNNKNYYLDAYGSDLPDTVRKLLGKNITRSSYIIQNYNTYACGEISLMMIYLLVVKEMKYEDIVLNMLRATNKYNKEHNIIDNIEE